MTLVTSLYAAALTALYILLSINVIRGRRRHSLALGDGGVDDMKPRIRAHANFAEYAPLFLILLALAEYQGLAKSAVHALGIAFSTARLAHAYGLIIAETRHFWFTPRVAAMGTTFTCLAILSGVLVSQSIF
ncbi:MAG: MAPEG family protein [Proteobacteria bacterium]|nr:MAPEG family protein [Pseudomonadota bacterium]